jgi:hypothetical protein
MILRMHPSPELVFEGREPEGYTGEVVKKEDWGLGLGLDDFFRLRKSAFLSVVKPRGILVDRGTLPDSVPLCLLSKRSLVRRWVLDPLHL